MLDRSGNLKSSGSLVCAYVPSYHIDLSTDREGILFDVKGMQNAFLRLDTMSHDIDIPHNIACIAQVCT